MKRLFAGFFLGFFLLCSAWADGFLQVPYAPKELQMARQIHQLESENEQLVHRVDAIQGQLNVVLDAYQDYADFSWQDVWPLSLFKGHLYDNSDFYFFMMVFALVFIGIWSWLQHVTEQAKKQSQQKSKIEKAMTNQATSNHEEDEYNYLASRDALPAKLDLARAYIAMEDRASAIKVLSEVIRLGDSQQQQEAQSLYQSLQPAE